MTKAEKLVLKATRGGSRVRTGVKAGLKVTVPDQRHGKKAG